MNSRNGRIALFVWMLVAVFGAAACSPGSRQVPVTGPTISSLGNQAGTAASDLQTTIATVGPGVETRVAPVIPQAQTEIATLLPGAKTAVAPAVNGMQTAVATVLPGAASTAVPAAGNGVNVSEKEYTITMPTSIPAGVTTFMVTNNGTIPHSFEIDGPGGTKSSLPGNLQPGQTASLTVTLQPGSYQAFCPIPGHKEQGMLVSFTVTP